MMVPTPRLLLWTGAVGAPALGLAVMLAPGPGPAFAAGLAALLALAAGADAWRGRRRLDGFAVRHGGPVRLAAGRPGLVALNLAPPPGSSCLDLRVGLAFPPGFDVPDADRRVRLPTGAAGVRLAWSCTPGRRGVFRLDACRLERESPLGFWAVRRRAPLGLELRVYPGLLAERRAVPALFLRRGLFGIRRQRQIGKGRDFEQLRDYQPGDSFGDIHWKATARRGRPVTKVFQVERTQEVYVVMDASRLSGRAAEAPAGDRPPDTVLERYIGAALLLARAAQRQGDRFGLLAAAHGVLRFLPARQGSAHIRACLDTLFTLQPAEVAPDYDELFAWIRRRLTRRALLLFLTQLDDPLLAESFVRGVELVRRRHLVVVAMPVPDAVRPVFSAGPPAAAVEDLYAELAGHLRWQSLRELRQALARRGVRFDTVSGAGLCAHLVTQYMNIKQRQGL
jgi:uncharacterized protein (DUF58 family)